MITQLLNSFLLGTCFIYLLERTYPQQYNFFMNIIKEKIITFSYNLINYYSRCEIFFNVYIKQNPIYIQIINFIEKFNTTNEINAQNEIKYFIVKDNKITNGKKSNIEFLSFTEPDLLIIANIKKPILNKILQCKNELNTCLEQSNIKFLCVEFEIGEKKFKIDLKTEEFNYYVVGNKFTKEFFIFYINYYLKENEIIVNNSKKCNLKIIDQDVNNIKLDFINNNEYILIEKDGYKLITN